MGSAFSGFKKPQESLLPPIWAAAATPDRWKHWCACCLRAAFCAITATARKAHYDDLLTWPAFQAVKKVGPSASYVIEAGLYALTGFVSTKFDTTNPITATLVEVFKDAAPEISSRLLADAREGLSSEASSGSSPYQSVASKMLSLDDETLFSLLAWLENVDPQNCEAFIGFAKTHEAHELKRFASLGSTQRDAFMGVEADAERSGWKSITDFLKDFGKLAAAGGNKGIEIGRDVLTRYSKKLFWLLKMCAVLWCLGVLCWLASALSGGRWTMLLALLILEAGCGVMIWWGKARQVSWLRIAGIVGAGIMAVLVLLTVTGYQQAVPSLSFMFLLGLPSLTVVIALIPLNAVLAVLKGLMPSAYRTIAQVVQIVVVTFVGLAVFSVFLFLVPVRGNPVAIFFLAPLAIILTLAVGSKLINVNPERFFGWPLKISLVFILAVCLGVMAVPDVMVRLGKLPELIGDRLVDAPTPLGFHSGQEIPFVDKRGHAMIWYAERPSGGYDLFHAESENLYLPDGRKLKLADGEGIQQRIREWVDLESARIAAGEATRIDAERKAREQQAQEQLRRQETTRKQEETRLAAEADARRQRAEEDARQQEAAQVEAERAKRASYITSMPTTKMDYVVCAADDKGTLLSELDSLLVQGLRARGKSASNTLFSPQFAASALRQFMSGRGGHDSRALELSRFAERLVLIASSSESCTVSQKITNLHTVTMNMAVAVIDPSDGRIINQSIIADISGPGLNETQARSAFFERFVGELLKRNF